MNKKWMPIAAGICEILAGFWMLVSLFFLIVATETPWKHWEPLWFLWFSIIFILGVFSVVGGVFALMRRKWRLALAGAATAIPLPSVIFVFAAWARYFHNIPTSPIYALGTLLAISPIALLILSKKEFE